MTRGSATAALPPWNPRDRDRDCYTCGRPPDGRFNDGSPVYDCDHPATAFNGRPVVEPGTDDEPPSMGAERKREWAPISRNRYISTAPRSEETEEQAVRAEDLFSTRYGLPRKKVKDDQGKLLPLEPGDFVIRRPGKKPVVIDIKWTKYDKGSVVTWLDARVKADIYVLVRGTDELAIGGWVTGESHRTRVADLGHGPRNVTRHTELRDDTDELMTRLGHPPVQK